MKIKVLLVMPNENAQVMRIPASMKFIKAFIGDDLHKQRLDNNTILIANKNSKDNEINRIFKGNIIFGKFIIVKIKNNKRVSMHKRDIQKYKNMLKLRKNNTKIKRYSNVILYENDKKTENQILEKNKLMNIAA